MLLPHSNGIRDWLHTDRCTFGCAWFASSALERAMEEGKPWSRIHLIMKTTSDGEKWTKSGYRWNQGRRGVGGFWCIRERAAARPVTNLSSSETDLIQHSTPESKSIVVTLQHLFDYSKHSRATARLPTKPINSRSLLVTKRKGGWDIWEVSTDGAMNKFYSLQE